MSIGFTIEYAPLPPLHGSSDAHHGARSVPAGAGRGVRDAHDPDMLAENRKPVTPSRPLPPVPTQSGDVPLQSLHGSSRGGLGSGSAAGDYVHTVDGIMVQLQDLEKTLGAKRKITKAELAEYKKQLIGDLK